MGATDLDVVNGKIDRLTSEFEDFRNTMSSKFDRVSSYLENDETTGRQGLFGRQEEQGNRLDQHESDIRDLQREVQEIKEFKSDKKTADWIAKGVWIGGAGGAGAAVSRLDEIINFLF